jgi:hypothetical protein
MTPLSYPRRFASQLLRAALSIAPHDTIDWGHGMLSELNHVEGNWSALLWAFGGAGVLAKHAVLSAIFTGSNRPILPSGGDLFEKESPMRKTVLAAIGACVVASLLFFAAPVFRQAFQVSLAQWHDVLHVGARFTGNQPDPALEALAKKAEQNHDAEGLAFVALRTYDASERARLSHEAVHLDPSLTWIYATAGTWYQPHSGEDEVAALKQWDPENALSHLIDAQKIGSTVTYSREFPRGKVQGNPGWQEAMEAAFQSPKLDTYQARETELDRRVLARYRIEDPFQVVSGEYQYRLPTYAAWYSRLYAQSQVEFADTLNAHGDHKGASEKYLSVVRFGQMLDSDGRFFLRSDLKEAYQRLGALSEMQGNKAEATFYDSLADQLDQETVKEQAFFRSRSQGSVVIHWNAFVVRLSGLVLLFCGVVLLLCLFGLLVRSRSLELASLRPGGLTLSLGFGAALGSLLSSVVLFVSYWPYSELLQRFLRTGDEAGLSELSGFLGDAQLPLGSQLSAGSWYIGSQKAVFYFWFGVVALCTLALLLVIWRFRHRPRAAAAA